MQARYISITQKYRKKLKRLQGKVSGPGQAEKIIVKGERRGREEEEVEKGENERGRRKEEEEKRKKKRRRKREGDKEVKKGESIRLAVRAKY